MPVLSNTQPLHTFGSPSNKTINSAKEYLSRFYNDTPVAIWHIPNYLEARERASDAADAACLFATPTIIFGLIFWPILPIALCSVGGTYAYTKRHEKIKKTLYVLGANDGTLYKMKRDTKGLGLVKGQWRGGIVVTGKELRGNTNENSNTVNNTNQNQQVTVPQPTGINIDVSSSKNNNYWNSKVYYVEVGSPNVSLYVGNAQDLQTTYNLLLGNNTSYTNDTTELLVNDSATNHVNTNSV